MRKHKCLEIKLGRNDSGYPVLPSPEEIECHDLLCRKNFIGRFMSDIYSP
jgi:hypothetical protein